MDRILEDPVYRAEFLDRVRSGAPECSEFEVLHALSNLRKRSKLPRRGEDTDPVETSPRI